jgi:hypothetical protein
MTGSAPGVGGVIALPAGRPGQLLICTDDRPPAE